MVFSGYKYIKKFGKTSLYNVSRLYIAFYYGEWNWNVGRNLSYILKIKLESLLIPEIKKNKTTSCHINPYFFQL